MSANYGTQLRSTDPVFVQENFLNCDLLVLKKLPCSWVTVKTGCGKVFYLDNNMYGDCYECLQEDTRYFTDDQCGQRYSFEIPF